MKANCSSRMRSARQRRIADFREMLEKYAKQESIMVVGHNPNLSEFLGRSISASGMRGRRRIEKRRSGTSGDGPQLGIAAVVHHAQSVAFGLRGGGRQLASEDFTKVILLFFHRPQFQVHAGAPFGRQSECHVTVANATRGALRLRRCVQDSRLEPGASNRPTLRTYSRSSGATPSSDRLRSAGRTCPSSGRWRQ